MPKRSQDSIRKAHDEHLYRDIAVTGDILYTALRKLVNMRSVILNSSFADGDYPFRLGRLYWELYDYIVHYMEFADEFNSKYHTERKQEE